MSSLKLSYKDCWVKVSQFLGLGSTPTGDDLTKVKEITLRGYRKFLIPTDASNGRTYRWYFLHRTTTLSTEAGKDTYKLPLGFSSLIAPFTHTVPVSYNPIQKSLAFIYELKSQTTGQGYPRYFAFKSGDYDALTGQQDSVIFQPTPSATLNYYYTFVFTPPQPVNDDDVFVGDDYASECILECSLAVAEAQEDEKLGIHTQLAESLIQAAISEDKRNYLVPNLGSMNVGAIDGFIRSATIYEATGAAYERSGEQILPET